MSALENVENKDIILFSIDFSKIETVRELIELLGILGSLEDHSKFVGKKYLKIRSKFSKINK